uniref:Uncharacterized protein n=1 Tax=Magallana gigas TaxID=29159 RepID=K1QX24_MAGGI
MTHDYWHQIQGQLFLTGTECCDLVVWTTKDLQIIRILKDKTWISNIATMLDFYFTKFLESLKYPMGVVIMTRGSVAPECRYDHAHRQQIAKTGF